MRNRIRVRSEMWPYSSFLRNPGTRLRRNAHRVRRLLEAWCPVCRGLAECFREGSWVHTRKTAMAVIEKYRDGLSEPAGDENQVNRTIPIHVAGFDGEAAIRSDNPNELPPSGGKLQLYPIVGVREAALARMNAG